MNIYCIHRILYWFGFVKESSIDIESMDLNRRIGRQNERTVRGKSWFDEFKENLYIHFTHICCLQTAGNRKRQQHTHACKANNSIKKVSHFKITESIEHFSVKWLLEREGAARVRGNNGSSLRKKKTFNLYFLERVNMCVGFWRLFKDAFFSLHNSFHWCYTQPVLKFTYFYYIFASNNTEL